MQFAYDAAGHLASASLPDGQTIAYGYDDLSRLVTASYADGTQRSYQYEDARWPQALTGITNEAGVRYASFSYDEAGRAVSTRHIGGAETYTLNYGTDAGPSAGSLAAGATVDASIYRTTVQVTDPLGSPQTLTYQGGDGSVRLAAANTPALGEQVASRSFASGTTLPASETDFMGVATTYTWDMGRQLKLASTRAANRPEARTTQTQWHPTLHLPVLVSEPGRSTAYSYDAAGNVLSETLTDTATGLTRQWQWSYNAQGLVASMTDPRASVWTYAYDAQGRRTSERNPLGQETRSEYDSAGRLIREIAPNGRVSTFTYDLRGRLLGLSAGGENSTYSYTPTGQLARVTLPDAHVINYQYDAAQRLIGASDNRGSQINYTLDAMGNRTREEVRDANGNLALAIARVVNSLNKVVATQGALGQTTQYGHDANGEPVSVTDPLNQSTAQSLDALRRPLQTTFADNAQVRQSWNALDQLSSVTDPKGVQTTYERNAFGDITAETSPDSGTTRYQRDSAGNVIRKTDALGQSTQYQYDAAGRLTRVILADGREQNFSYDAAPLLGGTRQSGYLSSFSDTSGNTTLERDLQGRITLKTQRVNDDPANPASTSIAYSYSAGQLSQISYPSGLKVFYRRDGSGQISGIDVQEPGRNKPVTPFLSDLSHSALGQPKAWRWASGDTAQRSFDADARMSSSEITRYQYDLGGRISSLTQSLMASQTQTVVASTSTTAAEITTTFFATPITWSVGYDSRNRLVSFTRAGAATRYTWDANGNRLSSIETTSADTDLDGNFDADDYTSTTAQSLNLGEGSNRLLGFTQTLTNTRGTRTLATSSAQVRFSLDDAGQLTSDGLRTFSHDASGRLAQVRIGLGSEAAASTYLHNALGQRVFKSEPLAVQYAPSESELGSDFISWLKKSFGWLFDKARANATLGQSSVYADGALPEWALLGEYGNGGTRSAGRLEYLWLPTQDGSAIPIGLYRNARFYAIHPDHLGTPRLITDDANKPVWQWPYSAFGANKPTGILKATAKPKQAFTNEPVLLKATTPAIEFNLRYPGQYFDAESHLNYNDQRSYQAAQGRYTQGDPIGLAGGLNRYSYVEGNPLGFADPEGLQAVPTPFGPLPLPIVPPPLHPSPRPVDPFEPGRLIYTPVPSLPDWLSNWMESRQSDKEAATDVPSWVKKYERRRAGESCRAYTLRILGEHYGCDDPRATNPDTGARSEYSQIKKNCERGRS